MLAALGALLVAVAAVGLGYFQHAYKVTPWAAEGTLPDRLSVCGRDYENRDGAMGSGAVSRGQAEAAAGRLREVARWDPPFRRGAAVLGVLAPRDFARCGLGVYLALDDGHLVPYGLLGGP